MGGAPNLFIPVLSLSPTIDTLNFYNPSTPTYNYPEGSGSFKNNTYIQKSITIEASGTIMGSSSKITL